MHETIVDQIHAIKAREYAMKRTHGKKLPALQLLVNERSIRKNKLEHKNHYQLTPELERRYKEEVESINCVLYFCGWEDLTDESVCKGVQLREGKEGKEVQRV